jgi:hypothetical protein
MYSLAPCYCFLAAAFKETSMKVNRREEKSSMGIERHHEKADRAEVILELRVPNLAPELQE